MRADAASARTWLFAGLALWALVVWALGLFGLGGRIERLPDDASLLQRLPQAAPTVAERLGPLPQYAGIGERPLFTSDRRPQPFFINPAGEGEEQDSFEYELTSVLLSPGLEMAILHPAEEGEPVRLRIGEAPEGAPGWRLASISPRGAVFEGPEGEHALELRVFDGVGGEPPTAVAAGPAPTPAPAQRARPATPPGRASAPRAQQGPTVTVTTSTSPDPVDVPTFEEPEVAADEGGEPVRTPESQVEAIRQRIEARRAQQRQQAQQPPAPAPAENP